MATDTAKTPAVRLNELRRQWGLTADEVSAQAQGKALTPLAKWMQGGEDSPEVVIRAVQTLLGDPECPGIDQRAAISQVASRVANVWKTAGQDREGMMGLQAALLAVWPHNLVTGGFTLAPLFESAWSVVGGRTLQSAQLMRWRTKLGAPAIGVGTDAGLADLEAPKVSTGFAKLATADESLSAARSQLQQHYPSALPHILEVLGTYNKAFAALDSRTRTLGDQVGNATEVLTSHLNNVLKSVLGRNLASMNLLWWGQARYSPGARTPYRRIMDGTTRLWWMAWEASELAVDLDVEPAASFLVEVLRQLGDNVDEKRPLLDWLSDLVQSLQHLHENDQHADAIELGKELKEIASKDALGMPVTWARLEATSHRNQASSFEERARRDIALDLDTVIDRGDWVVWLFREALLDRHLRNA